MARGIFRLDAHVHHPHILPGIHELFRRELSDRSRVPAGRLVGAAGKPQRQYHQNCGQPSFFLMALPLRLFSRFAFSIPQAGGAEPPFPKSCAAKSSRCIILSLDARRTTFLYMNKKIRLSARRKK
jgi:hypothetical protein